MGSEDSFFSHLRHREIVERIEVLEKKVLKKKDAILTKSQKLLLLEQIGLLEALKGLELPNSSTAKLLYYLCNVDPENTRKDLSTMDTGKSEVKTKSNYKAILPILIECGLEKQAREVAERLD